MRKSPLAILTLVTTILINACSANKQAVIENPYFGQKPPGLIPELFAPDVVSVKGRSEYGIAFSPMLDEMYFSAEKENGDPEIFFSKIQDGNWTSLQVANFTNGRKDAEMQPFVSFDGNTIYFTAHNSDLSETGIWYANRTGDSWSRAMILDSPVNDELAFYSNQAKNGDLYYTNIPKTSTYYAPNQNGSFPEVKPVEVEFGVHGFIAPDEDYLVVNARSREGENRRDSDIYVYFKQQDGTWSPPVHLGDAVNSTYGETVPSITPDGKYLFFSRYNEEGGKPNFYWVSTEVIHNLRPADS